MTRAFFARRSRRAVPLCKSDLQNKRNRIDAEERPARLRFYILEKNLREKTRKLYFSPSSVRVTVPHHGHLPLSPRNSNLAAQAGQTTL